jgi:hypothetical protein
MHNFAQAGPGFTSCKGPRVQLRNEKRSKHQRQKLPPGAAYVGLSRSALTVEPLQDKITQRFPDADGKP